MFKKIHRNRKPNKANLSALSVVDSDVAYKNKKLRKEVYGIVSKDYPFVFKRAGKNQHIVFVNNSTNLPNVCKERLTKMENKEKNTMDGVVVEGDYIKVDELKDEQINQVFHPYLASFKARQSSKDKTVFFFNAVVPIFSNLKVAFNLDEALYAVIKTERNVLPQQTSFNLPVAVRFVLGQNKMGGDYIFAEVKASKDVIQRVFLSPSQLLLLKVIQGFKLPVVKKNGLDDVDGVGNQADMSSLF